MGNKLNKKNNCCLVCEFCPKQVDKTCLYGVKTCWATPIASAVVVLTCCCPKKVARKRAKKKAGVIGEVFNEVFVQKQSSAREAIYDDVKISMTNMCLK